MRVIEDSRRGQGVCVCRRVGVVAFISFHLGNTSVLLSDAIHREESKLRGILGG